jgi:hypothetical protein
MTTHPTGDAPAASERVIELVSTALCDYRTGPSDSNSCCPYPLGEKRCQKNARAAIEAYQKAMREGE